MQTHETTVAHGPIDPFENATKLLEDSGYSFEISRWLLQTPRRYSVVLSNGTDVLAATTSDDPIEAVWRALAIADAHATSVPPLF